MKKVLAVMLAIICVFSASVIAFAEGSFTICEKCGQAFETAEAYNAHLETCNENAIFVCDYCGASFTSSALLNEHLDATFPIYASDTHKAHEKVCTNCCDKNFDGTISDDEKCQCCFTTKKAYEKHLEVCEYADTQSNWDKTVGYFSAGNISTGFTYLFNTIVEFVKSDTFSDIIDTVKDALSSIDLDGIVSTVKDVAGNIPFDSIVDTVEGLISGETEEVTVVAE